MQLEARPTRQPCLVSCIHLQHFGTLNLVSRVSVQSSQTTGHKIPENCNLRSHRLDNLKSCTLQTYI
jgi:hypothetical protein